MNPAVPSAPARRVVACLLAAALPSLAPTLRADPANTAAVVSAANAFTAPLTTAQKTAINSADVGANASGLYNFTLANVEV